RLDHLLSKEHHPPKGGMEPAPPECGGGVLNGGDTGKFGAGNGLVPLVQPLRGGGNELLVRLVKDVSTLLGPEGTTRVVVVSEP
ncbi:hypothetical protein KBX03_30590, partial [Micromonospora sp. C72]|uniref:hypothetical protein n=1 Tax=Micromonospora sp. C72 TaxID=2824880 RepID=UPI001B36C06B